MQHKNTLIAAAVTAALFASANVSAETKVYGKIHASIASVSEDDGVDKTNATQIKSNASRFGIKADKKLENGMTVKGQFEFEVDMTDKSKSSDDLIKLRNSYVGLAGNFGEVRVGTHDTPHKMSTSKLDVFGDTYADYNNIIQNDTRANNVFAYINKFGNVGFAAGYVAGDDDVDGENEGSATSVMVNYSAGPLYVSGAVESFDTIDPDPLVEEKETATKFGVGYKIGAVALGLVYETIAYEIADDVTETYISAKYKLDDKNTIKAAYGTRDDGESATDDEVMTAIGFDHKLDKSASVYALYAAGSDGGIANKGKLEGDASAFGVGFVYKF